MGVLKGSVCNCKLPHKEVQSLITLINVLSIPERPSDLICYITPVPYWVTHNTHRFEMCAIKHLPHTKGWAYFVKARSRSVNGMGIFGVQPWEVGQTDRRWRKLQRQQSGPAIRDNCTMKWRSGWTDGRSQVHYLPRFTVDDKWYLTSCFSVTKL